MDYRYLKAFLLTAEHLNFSKAAEELSVAQSAVSRQVRLLEERLGEELIVRSSKKVLLTEKGKELFFLAKKFDREINLLFQKESEHPLRIGILHGLLENWFHHIATAYYQQYKRNMSVHIDTPINLKKGLSEGKFDLIFTVENIQNDLISSVKLFDEQLILISKQAIDVQALEQYRWIVYPDGDNLFYLSNKTSPDIITVDSITSIVKMVKNGLGIAVVPGHVLGKEDQLQCYPLPEVKNSIIYMGMLNYKSLPSYIQEIRELINESKL